MPSGSVAPRRPWLKGCSFGRVIRCLLIPPGGWALSPQAQVAGIRISGGMSWDPPYPDPGAHTPAAALHAQGLQGRSVPGSQGVRQKCAVLLGQRQLPPHTPARGTSTSVPAKLSLGPPRLCRAGTRPVSGVEGEVGAGQWPVALSKLRAGPLPSPPVSPLGPSWHCPGVRALGRGSFCPQLRQVSPSRERERGLRAGGSSYTQRWHAALTALPPWDPNPQCPRARAALRAPGRGPLLQAGQSRVLLEGSSPHREDPGWLRGANCPRLGLRASPPSWPYLRELAPGDLGRPVALDYDGGIHLSRPFRAGRLIEQVIVGLMAGVQAPLPDFLVEPGVWGEGVCHLHAWALRADVAPWEPAG